MPMLLLPTLAAPIQAPGVVVGDPNRRALLGTAMPGPGVRLRVPSATVMVTDSRQEELRGFAQWMAPALIGAARLGEAFDESAQLLAAFMSQDPSRPKPPTLPAFWYHAQRPGAGRRAGVPLK